MEKLGESIRVKSELGKGTSFILTVKRYVRNAIALGPAGEGNVRYGDEEEAAPIASSNKTNMQEENAI
mgnify:FL=1